MTNVGILIKFTIIADQIQMFINVTGYQHKTIFFCCRHILRSWMKCIKQRIIYIYLHSGSIEIKSVALAQTSYSINYSVF